MGKSKFPGKPSKLVHKRRVSVLQVEGDSRDIESGEITQNSLPTTTTSNGGKGPTTAEKSSEEEDNDKDSKMTTKSAATTPSTSENCDKIDEKVTSRKRVTFRSKQETSDDSDVVKKVYNPNYSGRVVSIIKKESLKYPILVYKIDPDIVKPSRLTEIVKNSANNIDKLNSLKFGRDYNLFNNDEHKKSGSIIGRSKFSLPKHSNNSSRLIKPNKRFIFEDEKGKKKIIKSSSWGKDSKQDEEEPHTSKKNKRFGFNFVDELDFKKGQKREEAINNKSILRKPMLQFSSFGSFGAREITPIKSPFSLKLESPNLNASSIFTTSLVCFVCNSITTRKQPRKYGAVCCELCRKFMSKMIKKLANKDPFNGLQCVRNDGSCPIVPIVKPHKTIKSLSKERCYACWLKKCLGNFQLPTAIKQRLMNALPKHLNDFEKGNSNLFLNSSLTPHKFSFNLSNQLATNNFTFGSKSELQTSIESSFASSKEEHEKNLSIEIPKETVLVPVAEKSPKTSPKVSPKTSPVPIVAVSASSTLAEVPAASSSEALRQRILLKGPRVKHVCRSASIVLGQPIAVFASENESQDVALEDTKPQEVLPSLEIQPVLEKETTIKEIKEIKEIEIETTQLEENVEKPVQKPEECKEIALIKKSEDITKPITRQVTRPTLSLSQTQNLNSLTRLPSKLPSNKRLLLQQLQNKKGLVGTLPATISIDFWENYDPAEVSRTGFGLILSEKMTIRSLCFLCGSCGVDPLIHCVCCCEPYHYYCVEDEFNIRFRDKIDCSSESPNISGDSTPLATVAKRNYSMPLTKRLNWLCPRCTVCYTCNMSNGSKVKCQKCEKNYHPTCLGTSKRLLGADRPLICAACLKCKSCGVTNVTKFIGNLPMCSNCFKLRQKGNFCPLCQKCYENNDYDLKMMECGDCRRWVHARCEGLTDEQYNLLSVLPESIEFICKKCSPNNVTSSVWRDSVAEEFKTSLFSIIKQLSKSRHACVLLKLSPRKKSSQCLCFNINKLQSSSEELQVYKQFSGDNANERRPCNCSPLTPIADLGPNINEIKQKINENKYHSLHAFNYDMNKILTGAHSEDLQTTYNEIISEVFPWYQNETKACTDALEETMNDSTHEFLEDLMSHQNEYFEEPTVNLPENFDKEETLRSFFNGADSRLCMFCKKEGEYCSTEEGRLLYCGHNTWVHTNCALWSAEVYEEIDGSLQNVHSAISRGRMIKCSKCQLKGATVGCNFKNCGEQYHFSCARASGVGFMLDKRVFCPLHIENNAQLESNFEVNRSIYVELDRRKKKVIDAAKVQFVMGSLYVSKIGKIVPLLSDVGDYLVPVDFECNRMYWSAKRPWTIVEYTVRITIQRNNYSSVFDKGANFTVDHSNSTQLVQRGLRQISLWHNTIGQAATDESADRRLKQVIFGNNNEDQVDEEPQNNNDLLPPEIKDAIFEDLPHDVLDGISMFDIFPKSMTCEDKSNIFFSGDSRFNLLDNVDDTSNNPTQDPSQTDDDCDLNGFLNNFSDFSFPRKTTCSPAMAAAAQLKRYKHEHANEIKRRKLSINLFSAIDNDSNNNKEKNKKISNKLINVHKDQQKEITIPQLDGLNDEIYQNESQVHCDRCNCTYRNRTSYERHLATCEIISNSESESESPQNILNQQQMQMQENNIYLSTSQSIAGMTNNSVLSMINQQQNQSMSITPSSMPIVINPFQSQNLPIQSSSSSSVPMSLSLSGDGSLCHTGLQNMIVDQNMQQQGQQFIQPLNLGNIGNFQQAMMPMRGFSQQNTGPIQNINGIPYINATSANLMQAQPQYISLGNNGQQLVTYASQANESDKNTSHKKFLLPQQQTSLNKTGQKITGTKIKAKTMTKSIIAKKPKNDGQQQMSMMNSKNISIVNYQQPQSQQPQQSLTQTQNIIFQQQNPINQYQNAPLILNGNMLQYYSTADGQNTQLQYLPLAGTKDVKSGNQQYITAAPAAQQPQMFQNAFQLAGNNGGSLVLTNGPNGLSVVPMNQMTNQSQVLGTLIQPQALQCGVMSTEQMMLGGTPTLEMVTDPASGCMYLTSQPIGQPTYQTMYGLETIVQNTVMSSQQFVSTAMQGVLSQNSSYSTTTQVFQASKIEPIMEIPQGYVVLNTDNNGQTIVQQSPSRSQSNSVQPMQQIEQWREDKNISVPTSMAYASSVMKPKAKVPMKINKIQPQLVSKMSLNANQEPKLMSRDEKVEANGVFKEKPPILNQQHVIKQQQMPQLQTIQRKIKPPNYRTIGPKIVEGEKSAFIKPKVVQPKVVTNQVIIKPTIPLPVQINKTVVESPMQSPPLVYSKYQPATTPQPVTLDQTYRNAQNNMMVGSANTVKLQKPKEPVMKTEPPPLAPPSPSSSAYSLSPVQVNVVNPMQTPNIFTNLNSVTKKNNINNRPTNRVLPMQAAPRLTGKNKNNIKNATNVINAVSNNTISNIASPPHDVLKENYCEKIKSIALELQSSKNDSLFDSLRNNTESNNYLSNLICDKDNNRQPPNYGFDSIPSTTASTSPFSESISTKPSASPSYMITPVPSTSTATEVTGSIIFSQQTHTASPTTQTSNSQSMETNFKLPAASIQMMDMPALDAEVVPKPGYELVANSNGLLDEFKIEKENFVPFIENHATKLVLATATTSEPSLKTATAKSGTSNNIPHKITGPKILYEIQSQDGFTYKSTSITEIWEKLFETVQLARKAHGLMPLPEGRLNEMTGEQMLGLKTNAVKYLLEQLPGVEKCQKYAPKYHSKKGSEPSSSSQTASTSFSSSSASSSSGSVGTISTHFSNSGSSASNISSLSSVMSNSMTSLNQYFLNDSDEMLFENIYGASRLEPFSSRSEYDMFSWLASKHRKQPPMQVTPTQVSSDDSFLVLRRGTGSNLPMAMKYRTLKETYKKYVGVYRSHIHGRGLFCTNDIEAGEMVIEYAGELIRSTLTDQRERYYDSKGIGCYMFKIDDNLVVDATMSGTAARFINHSCDPNCYSKVVDILGEKHIIIFSLRRIVVGEELTYDYKFPFEDEKIPCSCATKRCRKYLN